MPIDSYSNKIALFLAGAILAGCANDNLPKPQLLGPLRVLALKADTPEVQDTGATVTITPIISDTTAGPRTLSYSYQVCADPGIAYGASPVCSGTTIATGSGTIATAAAPLTAAPYSGETTTFSFALPPGLLATRSSTESANGVAALVTYQLTGGTETTTAFRRVIVTSRSGAALNTNLTFNSISGLVANGPINDFPASESELTPNLGSTADTYTYISSTGEALTRTEKLTVSWFTTAGEFEFSRTGGTSSNQWTPPTSGSAKGLAIVRDDRGGVSPTLRIGF